MGSYPTPDDDGKSIPSRSRRVILDDFTTAITPSDTAPRVKPQTDVQDEIRSGDDAEHFELVDKATGAIPDFTDSPNFEVTAERRYTFTLRAYDPTAKYDEHRSNPRCGEPRKRGPDVWRSDGPLTVTSTKRTAQDTVATYTATDQEGLTTRTLGPSLGTDAKFFDISLNTGGTSLSRRPPTSRTRRDENNPLL